MDKQAAPTKRPPTTASTMAYQEASRQMHVDMAVRFSGEPDRDFAALMAAHDTGALALAKVELEHGTDAELRTWAQQVVESRQREMAALKAWLAKRP